MFCCIKDLKDRKLYPNIWDTSAFVIGWIFGRMDVILMWDFFLNIIIQTYAHSKDIALLQ